MPKQQFFPRPNETAESYKGFEINQGQLASGEHCYEAYNAGAKIGFFRKSFTEIKDAIDFYVATERDSDNSKLKYASNEHQTKNTYHK